jgi:hypothetical protein
MTPEFTPMDPELEQAVTEIRNDTVDPAVVEAAAARVWAKLSAAQSSHLPLRTCADFQSLIPDFRAGYLSEARATLVRDHLHECVACRKVYEGRVVTMPVKTAPRSTWHPARWAVAAAVFLAAGGTIVYFTQFYGAGSGRAIVQDVHGALYIVADAGLRPLATGQDLPDSVELRTAKDSDAMLQLRDGSLVELRERSGVSTTQTAGDLTIHLVRGSVIVQAAHRRKGHLYVATPDCRVAVTGTVFSVSSGVKGSRVSVIQGEVHVTQDNNEVVLHPGQQKVTNAALEPVPVPDDISWSRNRTKLIEQLESLHLPAPRYTSKLLSRLPASTAFFASIPNMGQYLADAEWVFRQKSAEAPELRDFVNQHGRDIESVMGKLRAASEYLGDEIVVTIDEQGPVFLAETRRDGFPEFLRNENAGVAVETKPGLVVFGNGPSVARLAQNLDTPGFKDSPFYAAIAESYSRGAGFLLAVDLSRKSEKPIPGARFFIAEQKEVAGQMETRASLGFEGPRTGIASWLAAPAPMGALDYISPDSTFATAFVVKSPAAIVDEIFGLQQRSQAEAEKSLNDFKAETGIDARNDLGGSLGGEFALAMDGPVIPVPSWKLVAEVYDPSRLQYTFQKMADGYNQHQAKPLRTSQEIVDGRTYYMIAGGDPNPLTEVHYTFSDGYLIAAPTRVLVQKALQQRVNGTSITHSEKFQSMVPRDHYPNFSAMVYQNVGTSLSPLVSLFSGFAPQDQNTQKTLQGLGNMKPTMFALYGEPDRITLAGNTSAIAGSIGNIARGNLLGVVGGALPLGQMMGTSRRPPALQR